MQAPAEPEPFDEDAPAETEGYQPPPPGARLRILFVCNNIAGLGSGYGKQLVQLCAHLSLKHDVAQFVLQGRSPNAPPSPEQPTAIEGARVATWPHLATAQPWERAAVQRMSFFMSPFDRFPPPGGVPKAAVNKHIRAWRADVCVVFMDTFLLQPGPFACVALVWHPQHFFPVERPTRQSLLDYDRVVCMSHYGRRVMAQELAPSTLDYAPHARPADTFRPGPRSRELFGWPEHAFVVLIVESNTEPSNRKALDVQLEAFARFARRHPDAWLHVHADVRPTPECMDLVQVAGRLGLLEHPRRFVSDEGRAWHTDLAKEPLAGFRGPQFSVSPQTWMRRLPDARLAEMYRSADLLLGCVSSEGFGVTKLEAQMCGTPVLVHATALPEMCFLGEAIPEGDVLWRNDFQAGWPRPRVDDIVAGLERMRHYRAPPDALPRLLEAYSIERVCAAWDAAIEAALRSVGPERRAVLALFKDLFAVEDEIDRAALERQRVEKIERETAKEAHLRAALLPLVAPFIAGRSAPQTQASARPPQTLTHSQ